MLIIGYGQSVEQKWQFHRISLSSLICTNQSNVYSNEMFQLDRFGEQHSNKLHPSFVGPSIITLSGDAAQKRQRNPNKTHTKKYGHRQS